MIHHKKVKNLLFCCLTTVILAGAAAPMSFAQGSGAVPLPSTKPKVDQLGQMEGVAGEDRFMLALGLALQALALVAVAIALTGHFSLPVKKKTPKA